MVDRSLGGASKITRNRENAQGPRDVRCREDDSRRTSWGARSGRDDNAARTSAYAPEHLEHVAPKPSTNSSMPKNRPPETYTTVDNVASRGSVKSTRNQV